MLSTVHQDGFKGDARTATCIPGLLLPSAYQLQALVENNNYLFFFVTLLLLWVRCSGSASHTAQLTYLTILGSVACVWGCTNASARFTRSHHLLSSGHLLLFSQGVFRFVPVEQLICEQGVEFSVPG